MKRVLSWILGISAGLFALLLVVYTLRAVIFAPYLKRTLASTLEARLGLTITIDEFSGTYLTGLTIKGIKTVEAGPKGPLARIDLEAVNLAYSPLALFSGLESFLTGMRIEVRSGTIEVNTSGKSGDEDEKYSRPRVAFGFPGILPGISFVDTRVVIRGRTSAATFDGLEVEVTPFSPLAAGQTLTLKAANALLEREAVEVFRGALSTRLLYNKDQLLVSDLSVAGRSLVKTARLDLTQLATGLIRWDADLDLPRQGLTFAGTYQHPLLEARCEAGDLDLNILSTLGLFPGNILAGDLSLSVAIHLDTTKPQDFSAELTGRIRNGLVKDSIVDLNIEAAAEGKTIRIKQLDARLDNNSASLRDIELALEPIMKGQGRELLARAYGSFDLVLKDIPSLLALFNLKERISPAKLPAHLLKLSGNLKAGKLSIAQGLLESQAGIISLKESAIVFPVEKWEPGEVVVDTVLAIDVPDLKTLAGLFGRPGASGSISGTLKINGPIKAIKGACSVIGSNLSFEGIVVGDLSFVAGADSRLITVNTLEIRQGQNRISGHGNISLPTGRLEGISLSVDLRDLNPFAPLLGFKEGRSPASLTASLEASGPFLNPDGRLALDLAGTRWKGLEIHKARIRADKSGAIIQLPQGELVTSAGGVSVAGTMTYNPQEKDLPMDIASLTLRREGLELQLDRPVRLLLSSNGIECTNGLVLSGATGTVGVQGVLSSQGMNDFTVTFSRFMATDWLAILGQNRFLVEGLDARVHLSGPLLRPQIIAKGNIAKLSGKDAPLSLAGLFDLSYSSEGIVIRSFEWTAAGGHRITLSGNIPFDPIGEKRFLPGEISLTGRAEVPEIAILSFFLPAGLAMKGGLSADVALRGTWDDPFGQLQWSAKDLILPASITPCPPGPFVLDGGITVQGSGARLKDFHLEAQDVVLNASGQWDGIPQFGNAIRRGIIPLDGMVSGQGSVKCRDIGWLADQVKGIRRLSGAVDAEWSVRGPIRQPEVSGALSLANGELRPDSATIPPIKAVTATMAVKGRTITINNLAGELGGSPFRLFGTYTMPVTGSSFVDLNLAGENLLLFRNDTVKLRADTDLSAQGPVNALFLSGTLNITDGEFSKDVNYLSLLQGDKKVKTEKGIRLFSLRTLPLRDAKFDVRISAKKPFLIRNNVATGGLRPELTLSGNGEIPVLLGIVYVDTTRIIVPVGRLTVESGLIRFSEHDPDHPTVDLAGSTSIKGYSISMLVEGPYDAPVFTLSSVPPLPEEDLLLLVLTGNLPKNNQEQDSARKKGLEVVAYVGQEMLAKLFRGESADFEDSTLDRFELEIGKGVTRKGEETIEAQFRLADRMFAKDGTLYVLAERDMFDNLNAGLKIVFRFK